MTTQPVTTPQPATPNLADGAAALAEYGQAIRGSWANIDGRNMQADLSHAADVYAGTLTLAQFRYNASICPHGGGHWDHFCANYHCATATEGQP